MCKVFRCQTLVSNWSFQPPGLPLRSWGQRSFRHDPSCVGPAVHLAPSSSFCSAAESPPTVWQCRKPHLKCCPYSWATAFTSDSASQASCVLCSRFKCSTWDSRASFSFCSLLVCSSFFILWAYVAQENNAWPVREPHVARPPFPSAVWQTDPVFLPWEGLTGLTEGLQTQHLSFHLLPAAELQEVFWGWCIGETFLWLCRLLGFLLFLTGC